MKRVVFVTLVILLAMNVSFGSLTTFGFYNITNNNPANAQIGEKQIFVDVIDAGGNAVTFNFRNIGPIESTISEIYFDDGILQAFSSIDESLAGVDFKDNKVGDAKPGNLPGGNNAVPPFAASEGFSIEPENPESTWGVDPGEWVAITYTIQAGYSYNDVIDRMAYGDLRIGVHVISMGLDQGSEGFVNKTTTFVPEPMSICLLGFGGLIFSLRKNRI